MYPHFGVLARQIRLLLIVIYGCNREKRKKKTFRPQTRGGYIKAVRTAVGPLIIGWDILLYDINSYYGRPNAVHNNNTLHTRSTSLPVPPFASARRRRRRLFLLYTLFTHKTIVSEVINPVHYVHTYRERPRSSGRGTRNKRSVNRGREKRVPKFDCPPVLKSRDFNIARNRVRPRRKWCPLCALVRSRSAGCFFFLYRTS